MVFNMVLDDKNSQGNNTGSSESLSAFRAAFRAAFEKSLVLKTVKPMTAAEKKEVRQKNIDKFYELASDRYDYYKVVPYYAEGGFFFGILPWAVQREKMLSLGENVDGVRIKFKKGEYFDVVADASKDDPRYTIIFKQPMTYNVTYQEWGVTQVETRGCTDSNKIGSFSLETAFEKLDGYAEDARRKAELGFWKNHLVMTVRGAFLAGFVSLASDYFADTHIISGVQDGLSKISRTVSNVTEDVSDAIESFNPFD